MSLRFDVNYDKEALIANLRTLLAAEVQRSETDRLRDMFDEVEKTLQAGVPRKTVHELLLSLGFTMTFNSFKGFLQRIRLERSQLRE